MQNIHFDVITEKGSGELNEDAFMHHGMRAAVFDGAGSLVPFRDKDGRTGGYLAGRIACSIFEESTDSLVDTAVRANSKIAEEMQHAGVDTNTKEHLWSTAFAAIEVDLERQEFSWAQIADSLILVMYEDGSHKMLIDNYDHDKGVLTQWKELAQQGVTNIRQELNEKLIALRRTANVQYGVLNGDPAARSRIRQGKESLQSVANILLFTDGMILPKEDPRVDDVFDHMAALFKEGGLERIKQYVRQIEETDPDCTRYPRYKKGDDITAIAISFQ